MRFDGDEYNGEADHPRCPAAPGLYVFIILQQAFVLLAFVSLLTTTIDGKREFGLPSELHERLRGTGFLKREFDLPVGLQTQVLCGADSTAQQRFLHDLNDSHENVLICQNSRGVLTCQELLPACGNPSSARGGGANFPPTGVASQLATRISTQPGQSVRWAMPAAGRLTLSACYEDFEWDETEHNTASGYAQEYEIHYTATETVEVVLPSILSLGTSG